MWFISVALPRLPVFGRKSARSIALRLLTFSAVESPSATSLPAMDMAWSLLAVLTVRRKFRLFVCPDKNLYGRADVSFGGSVETSDDFERLAAQLSNVTSTPNSPAQSSVTVTQGACPSAENSTFQASNTLPDTPDETVCNCLYENSFSCVVERATAGRPAIMGALLESVSDRYCTLDRSSSH